MPSSCGISCFPSKLPHTGDVSVCMRTSIRALDALLHHIRCVQFYTVNNLVNTLGPLFFPYVLLTFHPITNRLSADNMEFISIITAGTRKIYQIIAAHDR